MRAGENLKTEEKSGYLPLNRDTWSLCNWHTASDQVEKNRSCGRATIDAYLGHSSSDAVLVPVLITHVPAISVTKMTASIQYAELSNVLQSMVYS